MLKICTLLTVFGFGVAAVSGAGNDDERSQPPHDVAVNPGPTADRKDDRPQQFSTVTGRVMDNAGEFLNDVTVSVTIYGEDPENSDTDLSTKTGGDGTYSLRVPIDADYEVVDVEFIKKGFRATTAVDDYGGPIVETVLEPGQTTEVSYVLDGPVVRQRQVRRKLPLREALKKLDPPQVIGRVLGPAGQPLPDVAIRVAVPATDMRRLPEGSGHAIFQTKTREDGRYDIQLPDATRSAAVDAMLPGYLSASGSLREGGDIRNCRFDRVRTANASFVLQRPALYVHGRVTDEAGAPVSGARVAAIERDSNSLGNITVTRTDEAGEFEIFDYDLSPWPSDDGQDSTGEIVISHRNHQKTVVEDVHSKAKDGRVTLEITLHHK